MIYASPGSENALVQFKSRYDNFIDGKWVAPIDGRYFINKSPVNGSVICEVARSNAKDIDLAVDAAERASRHWMRVNVADRATLLNKLADTIEQHHERLAVAETWDNGKPIRETLDADIPLAADHFRYFASCIRAQESGLSQLDDMTVSYHHVEPLGVVGQIIPWNFPLLMAAWKIAPAIAAGNTVVLKPAEQTPASIMVLMELIGDLLPPGTLNIVNGFGEEAGEALASHPGIDKVAFTGETSTGSKIMHNAANNLIPVTLELGGKSPNVFCDDVFAKDDDFKQKALEGFAMFAFNQGEVCTCPSRALIQESIADKFLEQAIARVKNIKQGNPLDTATMMGAQASLEQVDKIMTYIDVGKQEGAELLCGGSVCELPGELATGYYIQPTVFRGNNSMQIFQEEIFGPVVSVTSFSNDDEAMYIANDSSYGLGAGVWSRDQHRLFALTQGIEAGRIWVNNYHTYPAHAAFGGYKQSGIGRETHKMMLAHYQRTKNVLVSHDQNPTGLF